MNIKVSNQIEIDKNEVLRYLEYKNQKIDKKLNSIIDDCIKLTKSKINPRYTLGVYSILKEKINDNYQIKWMPKEIEMGGNSEVERKILKKPTYQAN